MSQSLLPVLQLCLRSLYRGSPLWELHGCKNSGRIDRTVFGLLPKICTGELGKTIMSNYPDGMTSRDWAYLDGGDHHAACPHHEYFQGIDNSSKCYCGIVVGEDDCQCDCKCDTLYPSKEDIELEKLGL